MRAAPTLREWLRERPYALALSSGFFGFFAHTGLLTVLEDEDLLPARFTGSSAGALVSGLWASGLDGARIRDELHLLRREHFWDPAPGLGLLRGHLFRDRLESLLVTRTFAGCRAPLAISVYDVLARTTRVVTEGDLAPAIQASCCVPFLFHPVWSGGRPLLDGGIADRPGILGLPDGARALHHHLASRSPWRRPGTDAMKVPERPGLLALVLGDLPRVGPFRLFQGPRAFDAARRAARESLEKRVDGSIVRAG